MTENTIAEFIDSKDELDLDLEMQDKNKMITWRFLNILVIKIREFEIKRNLSTLLEEKKEYSKNIEYYISLIYRRIAYVDDLKSITIIKNGLKKLLQREQRLREQMGIKRIVRENT